MREAVIQAARATRPLALAVALAFGSILFITVLLFTVTVTVAVFRPYWLVAYRV